MAGDRHRTAEFPGFPGGVNNVFREDSVPNQQLRSAVNVDLLPDGKVRRRSGYLRRLALSDGRSVASFNGKLYLADGAELKRVDPSDYSVEVLGPVSPSEYLSYTVLNEHLYIASQTRGYRIAPGGAVDGWSPEQPAFSPGLSPISVGSLPAGEYQVAVTYLRGREESGSPIASKVILGQQGGIQISGLPAPSSQETTTVRIYISRTGGEDLFWAKDVPPETVNTSVTTLPTGKKLETQFLEPVPVGQIVRSYKGYLLSAKDNVLYHSQALRYGLCDPSADYFEFSSRICMVRPVEDGIYVATETATYFMAGTHPGNLTVRDVTKFGAVEGTDLEVPAASFGFRELETGTVAVWWSSQGNMVIGLPNGQIQMPKDGELSLPNYARGATMLREHDGLRQIVSVLQEPKSSSGVLAATDTAIATVYRNGIEI